MLDIPSLACCVVSVALCIKKLSYFLLAELHEAFCIFNNLKGNLQHFYTFSHLYSYNRNLHPVPPSIILSHAILNVGRRRRSQ